MNAPVFVTSDDIRTAFAEAMSAMYRAEVPLYGTLIDIVATVNARVLADTGSTADGSPDAGVARLNAERHGAVRVGTAAELAMLRRAFAVLGMYPVDYYDLAGAGVPVHSTAFRPIDPEALDRNPFRVFTSLLRPELIDDADLRDFATAILSERQIVSDRAVALIERHERHGGLDRADAKTFVAELLETFKWHGDALVSAEQYQRLNAAHRLIADIVSFRGPHINHLTPRTLDIDAAAAEMQLGGMDIKAVIEGPPPRQVPVLLRQTSFKALHEPIRFAGAGEQGGHTARFGEIEQRGIALTRKGRDLYDALLAKARGATGSQGSDYPRRLAAAFAAFPDDLATLRREKLAYFRYEVNESRLAAADYPASVAIDVEQAIEDGIVRALPIIYEDFLPVSAAGIFQSNLGGEEQGGHQSHLAKASFEQALGATVLDPFDLYDALQTESLTAVGAALHG